MSHQSSSGSDRIRRNEDWWDKPEHDGRERSGGGANGRSDGESFLFAVEVLTAQHNIIKKIAGQGNCVIVGRGADVLLANREPLKLFIYADTKAKIKRCRKKGTDDSHCYRLCINTSNLVIKDMIPAVADFANQWFKQ